MAGATATTTQGSDRLKSNEPSGDIQTSWERHKFDLKLVNPANKRKFHIIVVGTGLAGASAGASLAELGYNVKTFCFQDSPRRAHSIAAQGGINAAKNYCNDGDSVWRLFYDTVKGGTSALANRTSIGWRRSVRTSSTSASRREFRSSANMAGRWRIGRSVELRFRGHFTRAGRRGSSCCSVLTRP